MKHVLLALILVFTLTAIPAFAQVTLSGPSVSQPGNQTGMVNTKSSDIAPFAQQGQTIGDVGVGNTVGDIKNIGNPVNTFDPTFSPTFNPRNTNIQGQGQDQDQKQKQGQAQGQGQDQGQSMMNDWNQTYIQERELPTVPGMPAQINPLIQGGVGHYALLPKLKIKRLGVDEIVIKVLKNYNGWFLDRICVEDATEFVIAKGNKLLKKDNGYIAPPAKVRFQVYYKNKVKAVGTSGGVNAVGSALNGGSHEYGGGGGAQLLPGYNASWADPTLVVEFYEIE